MHLACSHLLTILLLLLLTHLSPTGAAKSTATSFCKCICFNNSTIIALNPPSSTASPHRLDIRSAAQARSPLLIPRDEDADKDAEATKRPSHHKLSCADCTRAFCLDYNLPICKDAREEDVFTTCFQRDSIKDETVVVIFIFATAGLLAWALVKPWVDRLRLRNERQQFPPLVGGGSAQGQGHGQAGDDHDATSRGGGVGRSGITRPDGGRGARGGSRNSAGKGRAAALESRGLFDADDEAVDLGIGAASTSGGVR